MKSIIDYLAKPENLSYVIILAVTFIVLAGLTVAVVLVYKRGKRNDRSKAEDIAVAAADERQMPENIVDDPYEDPDDEIPQAEKDAKEILDELKPQKLDPYVIDRTAPKKPKNTARTATENTKEAKTSNPSPVYKPLSSDRKQNGGADARKYSGKWVITTDSDGKMRALLKTDDEEELLSSENYSSLSGIKSGIDTLKKNIENDNYAVNLDKNGNFVFKIFTSANRVLCVSEGYSTRDICEKAFATVKRISGSAVIVIEKNQ